MYIYVCVNSFSTVVVYSQFFYCFMNMNSLTLCVHICARNTDFIKKNHKIT